MFKPFLLPGDLKRSHEELKNKLMVDFEPTKCFMSGLQASVLIKNKNIQKYSVYCQRKKSFLEILRLCGYVQEEFGALKPWYDHFGGDAIGLTWNKHNSKVKKKLLFSYFTKKIKANV